MTKENPNDSIEHLRAAWQNINVDPVFDRLPLRPNIRCGRQALLRRMTRLEILCGLMAVWIPILLYHRLDMPVGMVAVCVVFFAVMCVSMDSIRRNVKNINPGQLTVVEALQSVYATEKSLLRHRIIGWCMAIPLLGWMMVEFYRVNMAMFAGGCAGLIAGIPLGWLCWRRVKRTLQAMKTELQEEMAQPDD